MIGGPLTVSALALVVFGLILAFFGYRLLRFFLAVAGFVCGVMIGYAVLPRLGVHDPQLLLLLALGVGILGALLAFPLLTLGMFLLGAVSGALVAQLLGLQPSTFALLASMVIGGILAVALQRPLLVLLTAFDGSALVWIGIGGLFHPLALHRRFWPGTPMRPIVNISEALFWIFVLVMTLIASGFQLRDTGPHRGRMKRARE